MKKYFSFILLLCIGSIMCMGKDFDYRGIVYDVGLNYGGKALSAANFDAERVDYDMNVISKILKCNSVRIEGEDLNRLTAAARSASGQGLKVFFNPWKHEADSAQSVEYMKEAAKIAETLRTDGVTSYLSEDVSTHCFARALSPGKRLTTG